MEAPHCDWLADAFSAFANSRGGMFVLGVNKNSRDVTGIPIECLDAVAELVCAACTESVDPPIVDIVVERLRLRASTGNELPVIRVEIPQSLFVHRSPGGYLYRTENARRAMSLEYLSRLTEQRSRARVIRFDEQPIFGATVDDLVPDLWQRFRTPRSDDDRDIFLRKLRMARADESGTLRPTVTGVLMASIDPRQWIPNAYIQAVAYKGTAIGTPDSNYLNPLDAADIAGPLDVQVAETCRFVAKNMKTAGLQGPGSWRPTPVRHDGGLRGGRQRSRSQRLLDPWIEDQIADVRESTGTLFPGQHRELDGGRESSPPAIRPQRIHQQPARQVPRTRRCPTSDNRSPNHDG